MGSRTQDIRALTFPYKMIVKAALLCYLVLTPAVFTFTVPEHAVAKKASSEVEARQLEEARQFSDDDLINYGIWGFIAGLTDYFIRNAATAATTTTTTTTAAPRFRQKHKHHKKDKKEKQQRKKDKKMEAEHEKEMEVEAVVVEESVPVEVVEDAVANIEVADVE